jgi:aerobic C4-dicarboxylate transport protein
LQEIKRRWLPLAQAVGIDLSLGQQLGLLAIMLVTSKGGAGVAGSAIVMLASTELRREAVG